jgi:hypothetical protein
VEGFRSGRRIVDHEDCSGHPTISAVVNSVDQTVLSFKKMGGVPNVLLSVLSDDEFRVTVHKCLKEQPKTFCFMQQ